MFDKLNHPEQLPLTITEDEACPTSASPNNPGNFDIDKLLKQAQAKTDKEAKQHPVYVVKALEKYGYLKAGTSYAPESEGNQQYAYWINVVKRSNIIRSRCVQLPDTNIWVDSSSTHYNGKGVGVQFVFVLY